MDQIKAALFLFFANLGISYAVFSILMVEGFFAIIVPAFILTIIQIFWVKTPYQRLKEIM